MTDHLTIHTMKPTEFEETVLEKLQTVRSIELVLNKSFRTIDKYFKNPKLFTIGDLQKISSATGISLETLIKIALK